MNSQVVVIIGAGRSGTNILRDTLSAQNGWETWPCDEINLIWRHGNNSHPNDEFTKEHAKPAVRNYIRNQFSNLENKSNASVIVEKTCANSLRVPFVDACVPEAKYLNIIRDGRDVALSAAKRWTASPELGYLLKKLKYVPISDIPHYGTRFISNRIHQLRSKERKQSSWGPRFKDMNGWAGTHSLLEVCAKQWAQCVTMSDAAFREMDDSKHLTVYYEDFVKEPKATLDVISNWYGEDLSKSVPAQALSRINKGSVEGWRKKAEEFSDLSKSIMEPVLKKHGYKID